MACILVTLDGSAESERALPWALSRLRPADRLCLVRVHQLGDTQRDEWQRYLHDHAEALRLRGCNVSTVLLAGPPAARIVEEARARQAELVVMSTHGRGAAGRFFLGSVAGAVAREAPCPVWLVRVDGEPQWGPLSTILVPLDGSELALKGLDFVCARLPGEGSRLFLLTTTNASEEEGVELEAYLRERAEELRSLGWQVEWKVAVGRAAETILAEAAGQQANLIVMGSCGAPAWLGTRVAERVLENARCPVVLINSRATLPGFGHSRPSGPG